QDDLEADPRRILGHPNFGFYQIPPGGRAGVTVPYHITRVLKDWRSEYRVTIGLGAEDGRPAATLSLGTWSQHALVEVEKCYAFPEEKTQTVFMNIGVARKSLTDVTQLRVEVRRARDDQPIVKDQRPFPGI